MLKKNAANYYEVHTRQDRVQNNIDYSNLILSGYDPYIRLEYSGDIVNSQIGSTNEIQGGTVSIHNRIATLTHTTAYQSTAVIRHRQLLKAGDYAVRFHARWPGSPEYLSKRSVDLINYGNSVGFGYSGIQTTGSFDFSEALQPSAFIQRNGKNAIYRLGVTTAATGAEVATVTVNNIPVTVNLTNAAGDIPFTCSEIARGPDFALYGIRTIQEDSAVYFIFGFPGEVTGTFSFSSATAVASFTQVNAGEDTQFLVFPRAKWNGDSPIKDTFDITKWNEYFYTVHETSGSIVWGIFNTQTQAYEKLHTFHGLNDELLWNDPDFFLTLVCNSFATTTGSGTIEVGHVYVDARSQNPLTTIFKPSYSQSSSKTINAATLTPMISLRNASFLTDEVVSLTALLKFLSVAVDGTKNVVFKLYKGAEAVFPLSPTLTVADHPHFIFQDASNSIIIYDTTALTIDLSLVTEIFSFTIGKTDSQIIDLEPFDFKLTTLETIIITAYSANTSTVDVSVDWLELQ